MVDKGTEYRRDLYSYQEQYFIIQIYKVLLDRNCLDTFLYDLHFIRLLYMVLSNSSAISSLHEAIQSENIMSEILYSSQV
jgi:hypothetical protein